MVSWSLPPEKAATSSTICSSGVLTAKYFSPVASSEADNGALSDCRSVASVARRMMRL